MPTTRSLRQHPGQATAEYVALVVAIAALLAAVAVAFPKTLPLGAGGSDAIRPPSLPLPRSVPAPRLPVPGWTRGPFDDIARHGLPAEWSRRGVRRWYAEAPDTLRTALIGFVVAGGAGHELAGEVAGFLDDPAGWVASAVLPPTPQEVAQAVAQVRHLPGYLAEVRGMGFRDGSERVAHDVGHLIGRGAIAYVTKGRTAWRALRTVGRR